MKRKIFIILMFLFLSIHSVLASDNIPIYSSLQDYVGHKSLNQIAPSTKAVPVLMYHHIGEEKNTVTISPDLFKEHMDTIQNAGFTTITIQDLIAFVENGTPLPLKPVLITFDDGYYSNYEYAFPILKERNMQATIFIIGSSVGHKENYKETSYKVTPHFSYEEALEMQNSGLISIESHTFDMHQNDDFERGNWIRTTATKLLYESKDHFKKAMKDDHDLLSQDFQQYLQKEITAFAYPRGVYNDLSNEALDEIGIKVSFGTVEGMNYIEIGKPDTLKCLKRYNIYEDISSEMLLNDLNNY